VFFDNPFPESIKVKIFIVFSEMGQQKESHNRERSEEKERVDVLLL
jgi:hypothetical protein